MSGLETGILLFGLLLLGIVFWLFLCIECSSQIFIGRSREIIGSLLIGLWLKFQMTLGLEVAVKLSVEAGSLHLGPVDRIGVISILVLWWLQNMNPFDSLFITPSEVIILPLKADIH